MEIIEKKDNKLVFKAEISESLANAIRRYVNEIETLAVDEVEIQNNGSPLYDETVAHRIGLIPLKMEKSYNSKTETYLTLKSTKPGMVLAKEFKGEAEVVYPEIPITLLDDQQELEVKAIAKLGKGKQHAKFSPGAIFYRNTAEITMDKEFADSIKKVYSEIKIKEKGNKISIQDDGANELVDFCSGLADSVGKEVEIIYGNELVMTVESFGQMDTKEIPKKAATLLKDDLEELGKKVEKLIK